MFAVQYEITKILNLTAFLNEFCFPFDFPKQ